MKLTLRVHRNVFAIGASGRSGASPSSAQRARAPLYVNTLMVQEALALPEREGVLIVDDRRRLTPTVLEPHPAVRGG